MVIDTIHNLSKSTAVPKLACVPREDSGQHAQIDISRRSAHIQSCGKCYVPVHIGTTTHFR